MKQYAIGKNALPQFLPSNCERNGRDKVGKIWFVDETYIRVKGKWCYLYRGIDEDGNLVDVRLSEKRGNVFSEQVSMMSLQV